MASMTANAISGWQVINAVDVYYVHNYTDFYKSAYGNPSSVYGVDRPLDGLRIMDVSVQEQANIIKSSVESGIRISDNKVRMPTVITITGICDNKRGPIVEVKKPAKTDGIFGSIVDNVRNSIQGYEAETQQQLLSRAKKVYENIDKMFREKELVDVNGSTRPKTYTISTKGRIYPNMILSSIRQLNDAEHLMVIPVTIVFEELIFIDNSNIMPYSPQDGEIVMGGSMKKNDIISETIESIGSFFN